MFMVPLAGCDGDKCVADCDANNAEGDSGDGDDDDDVTPDDDDDDDDDDDLAPACEDASDIAAEWLDDNQGCTYITDCKQLDAICYSGPGAGTCGTVPVHVSAEDDEWQTLHDDLMNSCECGAAVCGEPVSCSDAGLCVGAGPVADICPEVEEDAAAFIAANRECSSDDDCKLLQSDCYMGSEVECQSIALNLDADEEAWARFNDYFAQCNEACGGPDCGATAHCSEQGQCVAMFP